MTERIETTDRTTASATASAASRSTTRGRGRDKVAPTSTTLREMAEEREEREEDVEKREEKDLYRNEPVARFNAKEIVRDINPQDNDSGESCSSVFAMGHLKSKVDNRPRNGVAEHLRHTEICDPGLHDCCVHVILKSVNTALSPLQERDLLTPQQKHQAHQHRELHKVRTASCSLGWPSADIET